MASKTYETPPPSPGLDPTFSSQPVPPDAVRMVGIRKTAGEHLVRAPGRADVVWGLGMLRATRKRKFRKTKMKQGG